MIKRICTAIFFSLAAISGFSQTTLFDFGWRFHKGGAQSAEHPSFDDALWRAIDLPHDWSIEDLPGTASPFNADAIGQVSTGFTVGGTAWYRKRFSFSGDPKSERVYLQFDGVYMNADIWLNGNHLGNHPYGYTSFWFDISDNLIQGQNVLAVQVKNEGQNTRWYSGSGIYRHVWLRMAEIVHVSPWGVNITTPEVTASLAKVNIKTKIRNASDQLKSIELVTRVSSGNDNSFVEAKSNHEVQPGAEIEAVQNIEIKSPKLWSVDNPFLYTATSEVKTQDGTSDKTETKFGIRTISFDVVNGFQLNGKSMKLKGGCVHHDNGPLGARAYDRAEERRVELLKASGFNAIRCAHNPPSPAFLDACDRLGMLVIDEAFDMWINANNSYDYHLYFDKWWQRDVESMISRDRNHPSIIIWSIGNEIRGMETPEVVGVANKLSAFVHKTDPTRPVAAAVNSVNPKKDPYFAALDVTGYNYARDHYVSDHQRKPDRIMLCTESFALEAYDYWKGVTDNSWVVGDFIWTAFDYIGESSIGWLGYPQMRNFYPWTLAYCGDIDICGWKRPQSYYRDVLWKKENNISIFVKPPQPSFPGNPKRESWSLWHWHDHVADWNWSGNENKPLDVNVYSGAETVELFLNGKSLGKKPSNNSNQFITVWNVPYQPGTLQAVGYVGKKKVSTTELRTALQPAKLKLIADKTTISPDGQSLSYITVELLDENGIRNPKAENLVKFELSGPGKIIAVANSNPTSVESFQQMQRKSWQGRCLVIVKSDQKEGTIKVKAMADGLPSSEVDITVK